MFENLFKHFIKGLILLAVFFIIYTFSFIWGMDLIESVIDTSIHNIRAIFYGSILASLLSFTSTSIIHIIFNQLLKNDFISWFRIINLIFLYLSGLITAIITMKPLLMNAKVITGYEDIFNDQFALYGLIFFIALANYNLYNALFLSREIPGFERFKNYILLKLLKIKNSLKNY
ncbi:hypothetical protein [Paenibacillus sp. DR312]|uniref:hypothetical protein n=1 Tax=Paenibacillus sp. DR312 TaxID=2871175 RepID=UPI001C9667E7|nr:hypothetical protein [Paenibacillus sp. DR312]QZN75516.1 hypothetical protein K5K90_29875 [Paenibacillus sp. DR312]